MTKVANIAADLDCLVVEIEQLSDLLTLYDEHREEELNGVNPEEPWTVAVLLRRQSLGLSLLRAIEEKNRAIQDTATIIHQKLWEATREDKKDE